MSAASEKWGFSMKVGWFMQPPDVPSPHTPCHDVSVNGVGTKREHNFNASAVTHEDEVFG